MQLLSFKHLPLVSPEMITTTSPSHSLAPKRQSGTVSTDKNTGLDHVQSALKSTALEKVLSEKQEHLHRCADGLSTAVLPASYFASCVTPSQRTKSA